jgi:uncharacterized protein (UPF0548 family)
MARSTTPERLDTSVTDAPTVQKAKRLMSTLGTGNADLYRAALDVFDWCVQQARQGRHIMATDDSGRPAIELWTPLLGAVRADDRITLDAEAFDEVVRILESPGEPTQALRDLVAESYGD